MSAARKLTLAVAVVLMGAALVDGHIPSGTQQSSVVDTTPHHKGHPINQYPQHAVCVTTTEPYETKIVPITAVQAYGDENGEGFLEKGDPCPG
jgi:hypothetical protein